MKHICSINKV